MTHKIHVYTTCEHTQTHKSVCRKGVCTAGGLRGVGAVNRMLAPAGNIHPLPAAICHTPSSPPSPPHTHHHHPPPTTLPPAFSLSYLPNCAGGSIRHHHITWLQLDHSLKHQQGCRRAESNKAEEEERVDRERDHHTHTHTHRRRVNCGSHLQGANCKHHVC